MVDKHVSELALAETSFIEDLLQQESDLGYTVRVLQNDGVAEEKWRDDRFHGVPERIIPRLNS